MTFGTRLLAQPARSLMSSARSLASLEPCPLARSEEHTSELQSQFHLVCRLLDYGKYKYEQTKKEREARRSQRVSLLREVRLRPKIGDHDFEAKSRLVRKLLGEGDKVKVAVLFRGREITHPELGWKLLQRMVESLEGVASLDGQPLMEGRRMNIILSAVVTQRTKAGKGIKEA